ncbi:MAG TPA: GvpL/GvpF family gas vesicle protein, partial [Vicinamibacterales bacterium]
ADAPLNRYGEEAINQKLSDLNWVSRAAIAHEAVVESFIGRRAVLPMKLFTIFTSDDRALDQVRGDRRQVDAMVKRVANHIEWGVRVTLLRPGAKSRGLRRASASMKAAVAKTTGAKVGASYLTQKKAQRDAALELAGHAQETVARLYDRLDARSRIARRRTASELPVEGGPLLLDAAFLVPRARATSFRALVTREARRLGRLGYHVTLSGPWPPYTFVKD